MAARDGRGRSPAGPAGPRPTARGLALLVAAAVLVLAGLTLGRREAIALGLFLTVVVGASAVVLLARTVLARRVRVRRSVIPGAVPQGGSVLVTFGPPDVPGLVDAVPGRGPVTASGAGAGTGSGVASGVASEAGSASDPGYRWQAPTRGAYLLGPALARLHGPFGLWSARAQVAGTSRLQVLPVPLEDEELDRVLRAGVGEHDAADLLGSRAAPDDLLVREHRDGDALTRVHWGATARTGRLMVRQEEWAHDPWAVVVLDCRADSFSSGRHEVDGGAGHSWHTSPGFERAVQAAAALSLRLQDAGHQVLLMDQDGHPLDPQLASAVLGASPREATWPAALPAEAAAVVVLLGDSAGRDLPVLATVPHHLQRVAVLFGMPGPQDVARRLESGGWLVSEPAR
ncbi:DUF58 domain-containing protein [Citricoccus sp. I39-566]|uniref:DUF58 domain-containing protein n=1 Tax=Citricoccus sp. I39-566 TaxID=3073268 RepID=UPI00286AE451|nr:DUF58 domain-containing protein [Citricoccus sp. I39-566]WMY79635.1 DUF58 domain-containing protein [Citricoccus sp. I39-566]